MKKISVFLLILMCFFIFGNIFAFAMSDTEIKAPSAILTDSDSGRTLYEKNSKEIRSCASITKIMTLILVMEALEDGTIKLDEMVSASEHAASMGGSDIWLTPGENMSVNDLIKAVVVVSANDAAVVLAERLCGTEESFVERMNEKAKSLEMNNTVFKNCNGLDEEGHVTCAYDVAIMSRELTKHKKIFDYTGIWIDNLRNGKTQLVNTNKLIKTYSGITGLKTGTTTLAGCCVSATASKNGMNLIAVVLGCDNSNDRFQDAKTLLDYGFGNFCLHTPEINNIETSYADVQNGMQNKVELVYEKPQSDIVVAKNEKNNINYSVSINDNIVAPIKKGDRLGFLEFKIGDETVCKSYITAACDVDEICFAKVFQTLLFKFLGKS